MTKGSKNEDNTVRTVKYFNVKREDELITISVCADGFLYNMVRIMAGTLMEVGQGKRKPEEIAEIIAAKNREAAGPTAPAHGLTLVKYEFL